MLLHFWQEFYVSYEGSQFSLTFMETFPVEMVWPVWAMMIR
jgi:hypothetical protein